MNAIKITINGFTWWYRDGAIYEFKSCIEGSGLSITSRHISKSELEQINNQINNK